MLAIFNMTTAMGSTVTKLCVQLFWVKAERGFTGFMKVLQNLLKALYVRLKGLQNTMVFCMVFCILASVICENVCALPTVYVCAYI